MEGFNPASSFGPDVAVRYDDQLRGDEDAAATLAVDEATVVTNAAIAGDTAISETWWAFSEAKASGITFFALAVAVIAGNEAQESERAVPAWFAWMAMVAAVASFSGWALGRWLGVDFGNPLWVASVLLMAVWTLWFGFTLMRPQANVIWAPGISRESP